MDVGLLMLGGQGFQRKRGKEIGKAWEKRQIAPQLFQSFIIDILGSQLIQQALEIGQFRIPFFRFCHSVAVFPENGGTYSEFWEQGLILHILGTECLVIVKDQGDCVLRNRHLRTYNTSYILIHQAQLLKNTSSGKKEKEVRNFPKKTGLIIWIVKLLTLFIMNKAVIGTVGGLVLGLASGYFVADKTDSSTEGQSSPGVAANGQRAPRFGQTASTNGNSEGAVKAKSGKTDFSEIVKGRNMSKKVGQLVEYYGSLSPAELAEQAKGLSTLSWEDRIVASNLLFSKWAETSPRQAMEYANKMGPRSFMEKNAVLQTWSANNPEAAAAYFSENKNIMDGRSAGVIAGEWVRLNPDAAFAWVNTLNAGEKNEALRSTFGAFAETNPAEAAKRAASLSEEELTNSRVMESIASQWAKKDWAATESWLATLPEAQQAGARMRAIEGLASVDPTKAAEQAVLLPEGNDKQRAIANVARTMAMENPVAAANLIVQNSPTENNGRGRMGSGLGEVMGSWVYSDTEAAKNWIGTLPEGANKTEAILSYSRMTPSKNYTETIGMASGIENERLRDFAVTSAVRNWMKDDPAAAQNWVDSSSLSEQAKQSLADPRGGMRMMLEGAAGNRPNFGGGNNAGNNNRGNAGNNNRGNRGGNNGGRGGNR